MSGADYDRLARLRAKYDPDNVSSGELEHRARRLDFRWAWRAPAAVGPALASTTSPIASHAPQVLAIGTGVPLSSHRVIVTATSGL